MRASRERLLREAAATGATMIFPHGPFPPWDGIVRTDEVYRWQWG